jgi:MFS family permease
MKNRIFYGWFVLGAAIVILVLGYSIRNTFSVFYPAIVDEFGWDRASTALMFSLTTLIYGFVAPLSGGLVDRFDPRIIIPLGACVVGGGIALCSLATTQWHFYLYFGVLVASGLSLTGWAPLSSIVSNWFVRRRGMAYGILGAGFGGSLVLASVAQFLITTFGWKTAYVIIGLSSIAIMVPMSILFVRRSPRDKGLFPDGIRQDPDDDRGEVPLAGTSGGTDWTLARAMTTYRFWLLFLIAFCLMGFAEQIAIAHQVYFFRDVGYAPMLAASVYSVFGVSFVLGNLCSSLSDRIGREAVFIPACLLCAGAVCLLFLIRDASQPWMAFLFAAGFGLGMGAAPPVIFTLTADFFHGRSFGAIQGMIILGFALGGTISPWLAGFLHDRTDSYFTSFLITLVALLASIGMMWFLAPGKIGRDSGSV